MNNHWIKEVQQEIQIFLENKSTKYQSQWDTAKAVLGGNF